ncbi:MAG: dTMP kinase [Thermomicrobiales bacterium]|nr:dTMP kinase [Thermomicrobiales bacterium]
MSLFVTFEGTEGSGKSTQIAMLADRLRERGYRVVQTREPGGTALGEAVRAIVLNGDLDIGAATEAYLMTAARAEHVERVIRPALADDAIVLSDRYVDSTIAYQGAGRGLPIDQLLAMQELAIGGLWPDLTLLLDLPVEAGLARRTTAGDANRIDRERVEFHQRVGEWFRAEAMRDTERWRVIDAQPATSIVHTEVFGLVMARLSLGQAAGV